MATKELLVVENIAVTRKKVNGDMVNRGEMRLRVVEIDNEYIQIIGHNLQTGAVFLNARTMHLHPATSLKDNKIILLYLCDSSSHEGLNRIFFLRFPSTDEAEKFKSTVTSAMIAHELNMKRKIEEETLACAEKLKSLSVTSDDDHSTLIELSEEGTEVKEEEDEANDDDDDDLYKQEETQTWPSSPKRFPFPR